MTNTDAKIMREAGKSRIRWLRRALIRIAMWGDPAAKYPPDFVDAKKVYESAKRGSLESQIVLQRAYYAYVYLRGSTPLSHKT